MTTEFLSNWYKNAFFEKENLKYILRKKVDRFKKYFDRHICYFAIKFCHFGPKMHFFWEKFQQRLWIRQKLSKLLMWKGGQVIISGHTDGTSSAVNEFILLLVSASLLSIQESHVRTHRILAEAQPL